MIPFPDKKYNIIYADPAWSYGGSLPQRAPVQHYQTMPHDVMMKMPVKDIAADDSLLFMWVVYSKLPEALEVIDAWGFKYITCAFCWVKKNRKADTYFTGMGMWTRANSELCLLAKRGKPKRQSAAVRQVLDDRIMEHSRKPDCVRERIVELCGDLPRIELFARRRAEGWDAWGNEV